MSTPEDESGTLHTPDEHYVIATNMITSLPGMLDKSQINDETFRAMLGLAAVHALLASAPGLEQAVNVNPMHPAGKARPDHLATVLPFKVKEPNDTAKPAQPRGTGDERGVE